MPAWTAHLPDGRAATAVDLLAAGNLPHSWLRHWAVDGLCRVIHDDGAGWVTADELEARTRTVAGRFAAAGLVPGDRVLMSASATVDLVVAHLAALRSGLVVVPANPAYTEREVAHLVSDSRPAAAVVDDATQGRWIAAASGERPVLVVGAEVALPDGPDPVHLDEAATDHPALVAYTSGTTGRPKGAVLSHGNLLASAEAVALAWRWTPEDRLALALPLFHVHGLGVGLLGTLATGATVALRPSFAADDLLDAVRVHQASLVFGVPTMWARLAASPRTGELRALRLGVSGSAPLPAELHAAIEGAAGQRVIERYGMTETVMNVSNPYDGVRRAGTVGLPLPGVEVRLDDGSAEILVRGPNVFAGYWEQPAATADAFGADGWFRTGDIGTMDDAGYLRIVGRRTELIISGGYNVYPREIEDVLRLHPAVADAAVVGLADAEWGERVVAVVEGSGSTADADAVLAFAADRLAPYKRPRRLVFVAALPRNALGKVTRADLPALLG